MWFVAAARFPLDIDSNSKSGTVDIDEFKRAYDLLVMQGFGLLTFKRERSTPYLERGSNISHMARRIATFALRPGGGTANPVLSDTEYKSNFEENLADVMYFA